MSIYGRILNHVQRKRLYRVIFCIKVMNIYAMKRGHDGFICSDELSADDLRMKRHSDAVFTDNYSRYRKQMAAKKYLNSVLAGKRR